MAVCPLLIKTIQQANIFPLSYLPMESQNKPSVLGSCLQILHFPLIPFLKPYTVPLGFLKPRPAQSYFQMNFLFCQDYTSGG